MNELPDIGTLWHDDKHGLMVITDIVIHTEYTFGDDLYTFHVLRVSDAFRTYGIFSMDDWHTKFTRVA